MEYPLSIPLDAGAECSSGVDRPDFKLMLELVY